MGTVQQPTPPGGAGGTMGASYFGTQPLGYSSTYGTSPATQTNALAPTPLMMNGTPTQNQVTTSATAPATSPINASPANTPAAAPSPTVGNGYNAFGQQPLPVTQPAGSPAIGSWGQNFLGAGGTVASAPAPAAPAPAAPAASGSYGVGMQMPGGTTGGSTGWLNSLGSIGLAE